MEQTLGKRIAQHRKRLGLTQDQLAEKLGITAQAVSKWENDLSCPDISMLPRLAEIFGITTDELLGREAPEPVHTAEVVTDKEDDDRSGIHFENDEGKSWSFHWDSGRRHSLLFALCVLLVGGLTIWVRTAGMDVSFGAILWPCLVLFFGIDRILRRFSVFSSACILFGGYCLVSNLGLWQLEIGEDLIFPICVVLFGVSLLIDALRKPKKPRFRVTKRGGNSKKTQCNCENQGNTFHCDLSFGEKTHRVSAPRLESGSADVSFGELTVDLSGVEEVAEGCVIEASCSFGEIIFQVPRKYHMECRNSTAFGDVHIQGQSDAEPEAVITLNADVSFGEISVHYI